MASIFDLWPASMWPGQPFIPPIDPAQPSTWPQSVGSSWDPPANYAASLDWPRAPAASQQPPPASQWNLLPPPPPGQPFAPMLPAPYRLGQSFPPLDTAAEPSTFTGGDGGILSPYFQSMSSGKGRGILSPIMPSPDQVGPGIGATSAAASTPSVRSDPSPAPGRGLGANLLAVGAAAARPITDWWPTEGQYARAGFDLMKQGWRDMTSMPVDAPTPDTVIGVGAVPTTPEAIRGLGEIAWGAAGYFGAPINAAIHTLIGQPVENITGIPSKYTDFDVGLVLPFLKHLPDMGAPTFGAPRVPRVAPSPAAEAAETVRPAPTSPPPVGLAASLERLVRTGRISAEEAEAANVSANAQAPIQSARVIAEIEGAVVQEAKNVMSSSEFDRLRAAYMAGQPASVTIGGRVIQYEPNLPTEGMSLFGGNGFLLGPKAFASAREASATVLHELYRLYTSVGDQSGVYGDLARHESNAAHAFAQRAISSGVVGQ